MNNTTARNQIETHTGTRPGVSETPSDRWTLSDGLASLRSPALLLMLTTGLAAAEVITVDDDGKADFTTIQEAIDHAASGDEIVVAPGVYTSGLACVVDTEGKEIVLRALEGPEVTVIDGQDERCGIRCISGEDTGTVIIGFTITGCRGTHGGGMSNYESSPTVEGCRFVGNTADFGGGMYNIYSSPVVTDCFFDANTASSSGGGMFNLYGSNPDLSGCVFSENAAEIFWGGGLLNAYDSSPALEDCTFTNNRAALGGGMYNHALEGDESRPTVAGTLLCGNAPDQVHGSWNNTGSNCLAFSCVDGDGDGIPEECGSLGGRILEVPSKSHPTIASGIAAAASGDVVSIAAGVYQPDDTLTVQGKPITLRGSVDETGAPATVIDGRLLMRVLQCTSGEGADTIFENLVITGGDTADSGGGMYNLASSPALINCTFSGNRAAINGGAIFNLESGPAMSGCTFTDNESGQSGGAMFNEGSDPVLSGCTFAKNDADRDGGGMCNLAGSPDLEDCTFDDNTAHWNGGGMFNIDGSTPTLDRCTFNGNRAWYVGGGLYNEESSPQVRESDFVGNRANAGGGMYNRESSPVVIDSAFTGNHTENLNINMSSGSESLVTSGQGGAIYSILSSLALVNCAFTDNTSRFGGAVFNATSVASVTGCSFNANTALVYGGGMFNFESSPVFVDTTVCANVPDQVRGDWTDFGGNLVTTFCVCPADFNRDGIVDGVDLTELLSAWGNDDLVPDMNGDGVVDGFDLNQLLSLWGPCR